MNKPKVHCTEGGLLTLEINLNQADGLPWALGWFEMLKDKAREYYAIQAMKERQSLNKLITPKIMS